MSEPAPAFSFYAQDFLVGTVTLSLAARGAYITFLAYQWNHGAVPADSAARQRILGCTRREADAVWVSLLAKFATGDDGAWRNARLEQERTKQGERRAALSQSGQRGAAKRWPSAGHRNGQPGAIAKPIATLIATPLAGPIADGWQNDSLSSSSSSSKDLDLDRSDQDRSARAREAPMGSSHRSHALCGVVCVPAAAWERMLAKMGGDETRLTTWLHGVLAAWQAKVDAGTVVPDGSDFEFWQHRWTEAFGSSKPAPPARPDPGRVVPSVEETRRYLDDLERDRGPVDREANRQFFATVRKGLVR